MTLSNQKHELFAQNMIRLDGRPKDVMKAAGYKYNASFFTQLKHNPKIAARIHELQNAAKNEHIMDLTERLEMLSDMARDVTAPRSIRLQAVRELHHQSGDDVRKVELDATNHNVVQYVQIELPKLAELNEQSNMAAISESALSGLDDFLEDSKN